MEKTIKLNSISLDDFKKLSKGKNKFHNKFVYYDNYKYASIFEASYAKYLNLLLKAGEIKGWKRQVPISIDFQDIHICNYICDFVIIQKDDLLKYVDTKGYCKGSSYNIFKLKKKLVKAVHGINVIEVTKGVDCNFLEKN